MWELDCEEGWAPKNWCFWTVVLEKTLESPLDCKEIQLVHSKGDQSWVFFGRNDAKAETPVLWPPHAKSLLIGKDPDAGRDSGQEEKGTTEDEMAGWHHRLDACEFEWTPGVGDGQGGLECCNSWGRKELDTTEQLNWTELIMAKNFLNLVKKFIDSTLILPIHEHRISFHLFVSYSVSSNNVLLFSVHRYFTPLVKCILRYFTFCCNCNGIVFLFSFSASSLLACITKFPARCTILIIILIKSFKFEN